jgi:hypothetical protein
MILPESEYKCERLPGVINASESNQTNLERELQYLNDRVISASRTLYFIIQCREKETVPSLRSYGQTPFH